MRAKLTTLALALTALLVPATAYADISFDLENRQITQVQFTKNDTVSSIINTFINSRILTTFYFVFTALAVLLIIRAGFQYMSAGGNMDQIKKARQSIINIVLAIILFTISFAFLELIINIAIKAAQQAPTYTSTPKN